VSTVLIASAEHLAAFKERPEFAAADAFSDADALRALDTISRTRPELVALDRLFAATSRGAALINRVKADPSLGECEIRIVSHDSGYTRVSPRRPAETAPAPAAVAVAEAPAPAPPAPLDQRGTRRAPRFKMRETIEVTVDGNPAVLVDVSTIGAQVVSQTILKPNQRVRMSLPQAPRPIRFSAGVAWAAFEMPKGKPAPQYRAGLQFFDADTDAIGQFIDARKA
jgi:hypothetical protein